MNKKHGGFAVAASVAASLLMASSAYALTPTFSASYTGSGDYVQVNISNADPNYSVLLDTNNSIQAIGTTNSSGEFSDSISTSAYNITPGSVVYVTVDGQQSNSLTWPYTTGSNSTFSLNQSELSLTTGESATITASTDGPFFLSSNSNPSIANVSFNGDQIVVAANTAGSTNLTVCLVSSTGSCQTETVNVSGSGSTTITFSQNNLSIPTGQTATVNVSGGTGVYTISNNSNSAVVGASISGNVVSLYASNVEGTASITVCSTNMSSCGVISVTVTTNSDYSSLVFSNTAPSLAVGQSVSVSIIGGVAPYYVSGNSNSSVVGTSISGNVVTLSGIETGAASVTICSNTNVCQTLPVTVGESSSEALSVGQTNVTLAPGGSDSVSISGSGSYYVSSNSNGSVATAAISGDNVVFTGITAGTDDVGVCENTGQCATIYVTVTGSPASTGTTVTQSTGSGLTLTQVLSAGQGLNILLSGGTEPYSISVAPSSIVSASVNSGDVLTLAGIIPGETSLTVCSANGLCSPVYIDVTAAATATTGATTASSGQYDFTTFLGYGSTGAAVTALQEQLTRDGIYSGPITGYYGDLTTTAVKTFQSDHGISSVGYVGPSTRAALNAGD
ncbi:MAG TPA: peptidoglycan-binding domain-containing protein [Candidatus Paceibacterota bacterium]|nr:peptidoglycan-binding domain-containing protein [Candidatus Paceibacterota bacterium]